jgi:predicted CoA-binding protein
MVPRDMTELAELLAATRTILLIDWPSRDVPDSLARHGFTVISDDGPRTGHNSYQADGDEVRVRPLTGPPQTADLVYTHRPVDELPDIVEAAMALGARAVWLQSGRDASGAKDPRGVWLSEEESRKARQIVEGAGLIYVDAPYIADAVRSLG